MKKHLKKMAQKMSAGLTCVSMTMMMALNAFAGPEAPGTNTAGTGSTTTTTTTTEDFVKPITVIKDISVAVVGAIGAVLLVWAVFDLAQAVMARDTSQIGDGLKKLLGGALCAGVATILTLMGF
jgi:hypothetical protein